MAEHSGRLLLMKSHGSGKIRLVWLSSPPSAFEVEERDPGDGVGHRRHRRRYRVTKFVVTHIVVPQREVVHLDPADANDDTQDLQVGGFERQNGLQTRAPAR